MVMKEEFLNKIQTQIMGRSVQFFDCTDSTNVRAAQAAEQGAGHGALFVADMQTAGKGRRGRAWESPAGKNLYFSLLLKPELKPDKAPMLTLVMALAVAKGLQRSLERLTEPAEMPLGIKWPNDLVINGRKICGILTEMSLNQGRIAHVVIGVGINMAHQEFAAALRDKATSIEAECGLCLSKEQLLADIMMAFEEAYEVFENTLDLSGLKAEYEGMLVNKDRMVCVLNPKGEYRGIARGIQNGGELLVEREDGTVETVYAGEVSVRGIYGYI